MPTVKLADLLSGIEFTSDESSAYLNVETGTIHFIAEGLDLEEAPEDIDDAEKYIALPDKRDLDLGRDLALIFIREQCPDDYPTVAEYFRHRGAYSRFKDFLAQHNLLQSWYDFEAKATVTALKDWCEINGITVVD